MSGLLPGIGKLTETFEKLGESWEKVSKYALAMEKKSVKLSSLLTEVFGEPEKETGRGATIHKNRTELIVNRVLLERSLSNREQINVNEGEISLWEAYNAVQGYIQHDSCRHGNQTEMSRIVSSFSSIHLNKVESIVSRLMSV
jgi:hypothetical protein